jgi:hypothetical protein
LQNIFPSFIIEQKAGWTDFLSTIPYYSLLDKETRAVEFILNLDSWKIQQLKSQLKQEKNEIIENWKTLYLRLKALANQIACEVRGVEISPSIIDSKNAIFLSYPTEDKNYPLADYIKILEEEYQSIAILEIPNVGEQSSESEQKNKLSKRKVKYSIN